MSQRIPIYIPTFINSAEYTPVRVLPHVYFFNGTIQCEQYYIQDENGSSRAQNAFPYFDNYNVVSGSFPTTDSLSLLFNNELAVYGETPTNSLYTTYWEAYISLLYNPYTRLVNASAIIPLADYFKMELNDIVNFKGNYYHLRAINDYSIKTGECNIQLLGPLSSNEFSTDFVNTPTTTTTTAGPTTTTTTFSPDPCNCVEVVITSVGGEVATFNCYGQNENYVYATAGTRYICAAVIGGLLQADIVSGTGTVTPVGNCKTGPCPPTPTTTTTAAPTTTTTTAGPITTTTTQAGTTTTTTTLTPGCFTYQVINPLSGPIFNFEYVLCGENFSRSIELDAGSTSSLCIQDDKYERGTGAIVTRTPNMCTTTTISPIACNTWVLDPGSSTVWFGNYVDCFGTPVSGAFVDSQSAPFDNFICALGTPQRISGGFLITSGSCSPTTTTTSTTTLAPGCFIYNVVNPFIGPIFDFQYVLCGENFSRSIELPGSSTSSLCIQDDKYERGTGADVTRTSTMCTTTTISPIACNTWILDPATSGVWFGNYIDCFGTPVSGAFVDSQPDYICALGTPERTSGGFLITSGSCSPTTTTTSTTTLAPGCFIYDVVNNGAGSGWVNYVGCGNTEYERFTLEGGASGSICVDNNQINTDNFNMNWTRTTGSCIATTTTTTIAPTTTTTTLPPFSNPFTADAWFDTSGFSYQVEYTGSNSSFTSSTIS